MLPAGTPVREDRMLVMDWATFGARILEITEEAVRLRREEESKEAQQPRAPFLRLVRPEDCEEEIEAGVRETGSAA